MHSSERKFCIHIVVVSDTILAGDKVDESGEVARRLLEERGFCISGKTIIGNNYRDIQRTLRELNDRVIIFLGGTGPSPRDITVDVVESTAWRCLPGFGEVFRYKSYHEMGARAILSRATLCIMYDGKITAVLPGSPGATRLGVEILSEIITHLVEEVDRYVGLHKHGHE